MKAVYRCCCGIDVHKKLIVACLKKGSRQEVREFGTMTSEIKELTGCEMAAMVSPFPGKRTEKGEKKQRRRILKIKQHLRRGSLQKDWGRAKRERNGDVRSCKSPQCRQIHHPEPWRG